MSRGYRALVRWRLDVPLVDTETGYKFFRRDRILPVLDKVSDRGWFWDTETMLMAYLAKLQIIEIPALFERRTVFRDSLLHFKKLNQFSRVISKLRD
jgi:hypothetical protein